MDDFTFTDNSIEVKAALNQAAEKWLIEASAVIESQVKRNTAVDTGQLKNSWETRINESEGEALIGSPLENAIWEEFGTGEYALNGDGRKGGWFYCVDNGKKITRNKDGSMRKNSKYKKEKEFYFTLGKRPRRALYKAFESKKAAVISLAKKIFKSEV